MKWFVAFAILLSCAALASAIAVDHSYFPKNHLRSVELACTKAGLDQKCGKATPLGKGLHYGAKQPDDSAPESTFLGGMNAQVLAGLSLMDRWGLRTINPPRCAVQHIHGNPLPVFRTKKTLVGAPKVNGFVSQKQYRNKMLEATSEFVCVSLLAKSDEFAGQRLGNFFHLFGDTYSKSHVKRKRDAVNRSVDKIKHAFSMDSISWAKHVPADGNKLSWQWKHLVAAEAELLSIYVAEREKLDRTKPVAEQVTAATEALKKFITKTCSYLQFTTDLEKPAGGSSRYYSHWTLSPVVPEALVDESDFLGFVKSIDIANTKWAATPKNAPARFSYPNRGDPDYCGAWSDMISCVADDAGFSDTVAVTTTKNYSWFQYLRKKYIDRTDAIKMPTDTKLANGGLENGDEPKIEEDEEQQPSEEQEKKYDEENAKEEAEILAKEGAPVKKL